MGHAMPYDTVRSMGHGEKISHRSWYARHLSHDYYFPMTHGAYGAFPNYEFSMTHGAYGAILNYEFSMTPGVYGAV